MSQIEGEATKDRFKAFYDAKLILRSGVHTMTAEQRAELMHYIELGDQGRDVQQWLDDKPGRKDNPLPVEDSTSTNGISRSAAFPLIRFLMFSRFKVHYTQTVS